MACWDEQPGERLRLPRLPAIAPSARDRERFDPLASVRCRERGASGVGRLARSQDLESVDSTKVVRCAAFALLPPSDFRLRQPRQNTEDAVIPFSTPMLARHPCQLNKVYSNSATNARLRHPNECSEPSRKQLLADLKSCSICMGNRNSKGKTVLLKGKENND